MTNARGHFVPQDVPVTSVKPPRWVAELFHQSGLDGADGFLKPVIDGGDVALIQSCIPDAVAIRADELRHEVTRAYESINARLGLIAARHPIRIWNFIPRINEPMGNGLDRYMVFNAGRHAAYCQRCCDPHALGGRVPTASGVGHHGQDLVIWCLASTHPGIAVENPQQRPSYTYSARYGPLPPIFARATIVPFLQTDYGAEHSLLVGGTASIRDEATIAGGSLPRQALVTMQNLALVVKNACLGADGSPITVNGDLRHWLGRYRQLRVYHPRAEDQPALTRLIEPRFPQVQEIEWIHAPLCRPDLLVEIEGVAALEEK